MPILLSETTTTSKQLLCSLPQAAALAAPLPGALAAPARTPRSRLQSHSRADADGGSGGLNAAAGSSQQQLVHLQAEMQAMQAKIAFLQQQKGL